MSERNESGAEYQFPIEDALPANEADKEKFSAELKEAINLLSHYGVENLATRELLYLSRCLREATRGASKYRCGNS